MKIKIAVNLFFSICFVLSLIGLVYGIDRLFKFYNFLFYYYLFYVIFFVFLNLFFILVFFLNNQVKINIFLIFFSSVIGIYSVQTVFFLLNKPDIKRKNIAQERNFIENNIVREIDKLETHTNYFPTALIEVIKSQNSDMEDTFLPLSGLSNKKIKMNTEDGRFIYFLSDRFGFNNPDEVYDNKVNVLLLGDSFTEGYAVLQENTIGGHLRKKNINSVSLGKRNSSIFQQYAIFKEYGAMLKPKNIFLLYYEGNDFVELNNEINVSILKRYIFEDNFNQSLISRQNEINKYLIKLEDKEKKLNKIYLEQDFNFKHNVIIEFITLRKIRNKIYDVYFRKRKGINIEKVLFNYQLALNKIKDLSNTWGGNLVFVYIPHNLQMFKWKNFIHDRTGVKVKKEILNLVKDTKIKIIDLEKEMFDKIDNPYEYYPLQTPDFNHLNSKGYEKISSLIANNLK